MARPLKPADPESVVAVSGALAALKTARDTFARHGCEQTAARVRLAITSANGALRHIERRAAETAGKENHDRS